MMKICCKRLSTAIENPKTPVSLHSLYREIAIDYGIDRLSYLVINYCPWCGTALPGSLRDQWFDTLAKRGIDPGVDAVPKEFMDARWYSRRARRPPARRHKRRPLMSSPKKRTR